MDPYDIQFGVQGLYMEEYKVTNSKLGREKANEVSCVQTHLRHAYLKYCEIDFAYCRSYDNFYNIDMHHESPR